jgi:hypothetical protein
MEGSAKKKRTRRSRRLFTQEEDDILMRAIETIGLGSWEKIANHVPDRSSRQCRDRWINYLAPSNRKDPWTEDEDRRLLEQMNQFGTHWSAIANAMGNRSENNLKNRWYSHLKKRSVFDNGRFILMSDAEKRSAKVSQASNTGTADFWDKRLLHEAPAFPEPDSNPDQSEKKDAKVEEVMFDCWSML